MTRAMDPISCNPALPRVFLFLVFIFRFTSEHYLCQNYSNKMTNLLDTSICLRGAGSSKALLKLTIYYLLPSGSFSATRL